MKVLAFGEILWDIIDGHEHLGGAPFNFAAHSVQCGDEAFIISRLGNDALGRRAFDQCKQHGVNTSLIQWDDDHGTGTVDVRLNNGQPDYTINKNVAYDFISNTPQLKSIGTDYFDVFYFGSLAQRNPVSSETLQSILRQCSFKHIFYDVNLRKEGYSAEIINWSLSAASIFKLNHEEVPVLSSLLFNQKLTNDLFCMKVCLKFPNLKLVIITAAEKGCYVFYDGKLNHTPCASVKVADAVGAGDAFSAAFMNTISKHNNPIEASRVANMVGGFVASQPGAIPSYPNELQKEIKNSQKSSI
jgi:fructokinase